MELPCDHTSAGVIIENENNEMLLIERARYPFGWAAPAGHSDDHGSPEETATAEVYEEVGLVIATSSLVHLISDRRVELACRRKGGDYHIWNVYKTKIESQATNANEEETLGLKWFSTGELQELADSTRNDTAQENKAGAKVIELVWLNFFTELGYIK